MRNGWRVTDDEPDVSQYLTEGIVAAIIITVDENGMLDLYSQQTVDIDISSVLRCAIELNDDDEVSGKLN